MPLLFSYALLAGCASSGPAAPRAASEPSSGASSAPRYNLTGYSAGFKRGYADACSGRPSDPRHQGDNDYQMGWNDGRSICGK